MIKKHPEPLMTGVLVVFLLLSASWRGLSTAGSINPPQRKPATVRVQTTVDGFTGSCDTGSETAGLEASRASDGSSLSRIRHADGHMVVETMLKGNLVEFRFPTAKLTMDVGNRTLVGTSAKDKEDLQKFLESSD